jgi:pimeloyl-ACP methyl ester carboxylesterase
MHKTFTGSGFNFASLIGTVYFTASKPTAVYIHGFNSNYYTSPNVEIINAYIARGDHNIIAVDWRLYAQGPNFLDVSSTLNDVRIY